jgi:hypothetical protein
VIKRRKFVKVSFMKEICHAPHSTPPPDFFVHVRRSSIGHLVVECLAPVVAAGFYASVLSLSLRFGGILLLRDPLIDLVDFLVQVRHPVIESFEPVEKPPLHMADG